MVLPRSNRAGHRLVTQLFLTGSFPWPDKLTTCMAPPRSTPSALRGERGSSWAQRCADGLCCGQERLGAAAPAGCGCRQRTRAGHLVARCCSISQERGASASISTTPAPPSPGPAPQTCAGVLSRALYDFGALPALAPSILPQSLPAAVHTGRVTLPGAAARPAPVAAPLPLPSSSCFFPCLSLPSPLSWTLPGAGAVGLCHQVSRETHRYFLSGQTSSFPSLLSVIKSGGWQRGCPESRLGVSPCRLPAPWRKGRQGDADTQGGCRCSSQSWLLVGDRIHLDLLRVHPGSLPAQPPLTVTETQTRPSQEWRNRRTRGFPSAPMGLGAAGAAGCVPTCSISSWLVQGPCPGCCIGALQGPPGWAQLPKAEQKPQSPAGVASPVTLMSPGGGGGRAAWGLAMALPGAMPASGT